MGSFLIQVHDSTGQLKSITPGASTGVKLNAEASNTVAWFENETDRLFKYVKNEVCAQVADSPGWRPTTGVWSADGRYLFAFGLIDILVPFSLFPKLQYLGEEIISCGN